jgi:hypothetical protein
MFHLRKTVPLEPSVSKHKIIQNLSFKSKQEWEELCEGDEQCLYDAAALGSLEVGEKTRDAHRYYRTLHENMKSGNKSLELLQTKK